MVTQEAGGGQLEPALACQRSGAKLSDLDPLLRCVKAAVLPVNGSEARLVGNSFVTAAERHGCGSHLDGKKAAVSAKWAQHELEHSAGSASGGACFDVSTPPGVMNHGSAEARQQVSGRSPRGVFS